MDKDFSEYILKKTIRDYDMISDDFARKRKEPSSELKFLFDNYITPGDKVLDLGCGNGQYYKFVADKYAEYLGIDTSQKLIDICKENIPEGKFQKANALNLPLPDNQFDKIYCIAVLHHMPSDELRLAFLQEIKRVLKPNGLAIITVWRFYRFNDLMRIFFNNLKFSKLGFNDIFVPWGKVIERYFHFFRRKELINLAMRTKFTIKEIGLTKNKTGDRRSTYIVLQK